jgi:hypothetical protein
MMTTRGLLQTGCVSPVAFFYADRGRRLRVFDLDPLGLRPGLCCTCRYANARNRRSGLPEQNVFPSMTDEVFLSRSRPQHQRLTIGSVIAAVGQQPHALAFTLNDQPVAVVLDFVKPIRAGWNFGAAGWDAGLILTQHAGNIDPPRRNASPGTASKPRTIGRLARHRAGRRKSFSRSACELRHIALPRIKLPCRRFLPD